ncbi:MAG: aminodeoxychorismate/anthranilate synthase component II [Hornefia sp.]|nr:aminodeoxychorismate/anthranilate synthase component II [Hornefia sp.]
MILVLDNYDSYVYNLVAYLKEAGENVVVRTPENFREDEVCGFGISGVLLSPGPGHPEESQVMKKIMDDFAGRTPILGVCLGHQFIATYYGGEVIRGERPMHGKLTKVCIENGADEEEIGIFQGIPKEFTVTRYHSLVATEPLPKMLKVTARDEDGVIMGLSHREIPVFGVQFHPEALQTEYGHELINNFIRICNEN